VESVEILGTIREPARKRIQKRRRAENYEKRRHVRMVGVFAALVVKWVTTFAHARQSTLRLLRKGGGKSQCGELVLAVIVEKWATTLEPAPI